MNTCVNHPTRQATSRCKRCGKPICDDCKMVSEVGVVCSEQCLDAIKAFQERVGDDLPRRRRNPVQTILKWVAILGVVIAVAYGVMCFMEGELLTPGSFVESIKALIEL